MKLNKFLQEIALGDLQGSNVVEAGGYKILTDKLPVVLNSLNKSLEYIFSILPLKQNQVIIQLIDGVSNYYLSSDYASSNPDAKMKYIKDSVSNPFKDDLINIESIFTNTGEELNINDNFSMYGVYTPEYNCIRITDQVLAFKYLIVVYKALHQKIPLDTPEESCIDINIPPALNDALQALVASNVYRYSGLDDSITKGSFYYGKFKTIVDELLNEGVLNKTRSGVNINPVLGGWL